MLELHINMLSDLALSLTPSPTVSLDAKVKALQAEGVPVVSLCIGEPDFVTPVHIQKAATKAMRDGFTHYTQAAGLPDLRKAVAEKFYRDNNMRFDSSEIIVGPGSKPLLFLSFQVLLNRGDEVLIPVPAWNTFAEQVRLCSGKPVFVTLNPPFKLTASDIERHISKKTKILLINSPANPTGAIIEKAELKKIAELSVKHNFYILSDEIYEKLMYTGTHSSIASLSKGLNDRIITVNGFSKSYAMTGWRIGFAGGPKNIIRAMTDLQSQTSSSGVTFAQMAGIKALNGDQWPLHKMLAEFTKRRKFILSELKKIPDISFTEPEGAFYVFAAIGKLLGGKYKTSADWCNALLDEQLVAVVPGEAFFYPSYFRLSYAASMENLRKGVEGIRKFVNS